jgi:poly(3-hydroxybutyrate) depolymerase
MIKLLVIIGIVIGLVIIYIIFITLVPGLKIQKQALSRIKASSGPGTASLVPGRKDVSFMVKGDAISAWLYLPDIVDSKIPCVVMANGTGGTKDMLLEGYALRFQAAGMAVLMRAASCPAPLGS